MKWPTQDGMAELDTALCRLGDSKPGDVLVIRYGQYATKGDALAFRHELVEAASKLPSGAIKHPVPVVVAPEGVAWEFAATGKLVDPSEEPA